MSAIGSLETFNSLCVTTFGADLIFWVDVIVAMQRCQELEISSTADGRAEIEGEGSIAWARRGCSGLGP